MMNISCVSSSLWSAEADLLWIPLASVPVRWSKLGKEIDARLNGALSQLFAEELFEGKAGQTVVIPTHGLLPWKRVGFVGIGNGASGREELFRRAGGAVVKASQKARTKRVALMWERASEEAAFFAEGMWLASYQFHTYHGTQRKKKPESHVALEHARLYCATAADAKGLQRRLESVRSIVEAVGYARDLVNTPSAQLTPAQLADEARRWSGERVEVRVLEEHEMERLGMEATLAVARGSTHRPVGVQLIYRPPRPKKRIAVIGKAVTFDSGGLSLKPADSMTTMKIDMAGAAAVLGLFRVLPSLKLPVEVHGIFLAVENMPSGSAYRPGDVVTVMDGTTVEVLNTDAEGRLTLADALCYAREQKPDVILDLATLTGACVVALGEEIAGLCSSNAHLTRQLLDASRHSGDLVWELPMLESYRELIQSKIADLKNVGGKAGGAITAALFLKTFAGEIPWAHLDIAGPSYVERETRPDFPYGGSGFGVRLLVEYLRMLDN